MIASVIEDAGDEEAGKHKEDINTGPAPVEVGVIGSNVVLEDDEKDRNGAQTIERRIETLILTKANCGAACILRDRKTRDAKPW